MSFNKYNISAAILALMIVLGFSSCAVKILGYGVVLWAEKGIPFKTGTVLKINDESRIRKTYIIEISRKEKYEIPIRNLKLFDSKEQAYQFADSYKPDYLKFGFSLHDGLPIREKPKANSPRLYKLRKGEVVKILRRGKSRVSVGSYDDYWYYVLAKDGTAGYCFGHFLRTFSTEGDPLKKVAQLMSQDPMLDILLKNVWRPEYYREMLDRNHIDLKKFRVDIGLFPDPENKYVKLVTDKYSLSFNYSAIEKVGGNHYAFKGTDLRVAMYGKSKAVISYKVGNQNISAVYFIIIKNIQNVIETELTRRDNLFAGLLAHGDRLISDFYGTINLLEGRRFKWTGFDKLKGIVLKQDVRGTGMIDFPYFLSNSLKTKYDGIIAFKFDDLKQGKSIDFLYKIFNNGIRLVFIKRKEIKDLEVIGVEASALVMYFKFSGGQE
ncbi:MAG: SH3 domain-containing protein [Spirochaetes bacterium]|nr:SH3 domain-containing protein [Spirochaetota bacterium]